MRTCSSIGWGKKKTKGGSHLSLQPVTVDEKSRVTVHLHYFIERLHVLLHAVMGAQVGHKVARVHAIKTVEE